MRSFWNNLGDPSLHLMATALLLAFGGPWPGQTSAEDPLPFCSGCKSHYLPSHACKCEPAGIMAHLMP